MVQPDEIYNLAAQSHVAVSFEEPEYANSDASGLCVCSSDSHSRPRKENPVLPGIDIRALREGAANAAKRNDAVLSTPPYAAAKLYAYWITVNYREAYGIMPATEFCSITSLRLARDGS